MTPWAVFYVFLVLAIVIGLVFVYVALSTRTSREVDYGAANRWRQRFFIVLTGTLVVVLALSLPRMPYPAETQRPDRVVYVAGKQYAFARHRRSLRRCPSPTAELSVASAGP